MITQIHLTLRDRFGILYWFGKRGDGLPLHMHRGPTAELAHDVLCTSGRIKVTVETAIGTRVHQMGAGEQLALPNCPHEIAALEDGSSFIGILHNGRPKGYASLPESERRVSYEAGTLEYPPQESER